MTLWHVMRLETPANGIVGLECLSGQYPVQITLRDLDTGNESVVQACWADTPGIHGQCDNLELLNGTYSPNDWTDECEA